MERDVGATVFLVLLSYGDRIRRSKTETSIQRRLGELVDPNSRIDTNVFQSHRDQTGQLVLREKLSTERRTYYRDLRIALVRVCSVALTVTSIPQRSLDSVRLDQLDKYLSGKPYIKGLRLGAGYQAFVELYETPFGNFVVKRARGPFFWRRLGQTTIRREYEIYERLQGVQGVPHCLGLLDDKHLVLEHIPGDSYRQRQHSLQNRELFFVRLLETLRDIHAANVAHGDLKRKDNLLVGPDERPFIIDFGLACIRDGSKRRLNRFFFEWGKQYDYNAWIKHKYHRRVDAILPEDIELYQPLKLERIARGIRILWQKITLRRLRKRLRRSAGTEID